MGVGVGAGSVIGAATGVGGVVEQLSSHVAGQSV